MNASLPLIYGTQYDGKNYTPGKYINELDTGLITFFSGGQLELANQQVIDGKMALVNSSHLWVGELQGKAKDSKITRFRLSEVRRLSCMERPRSWSLTKMDQW